ncbi:hypothetical protein [Kangiella sp. TOML190]|uniref:hypothetical protein n=1 Tax=Kangiella sp. TOML190 TaxID=2931351 RepID=UPI00203C7859|nr:hypothetical protein [Kangiella sp. TOML190]
MKLRKYLILFLAMMPLALYAGYTQPYPVEVDTVNRIANGDMVSARFADNDLEFIGCGIRQIASGGSVISFGFCQAREGAEGSESLICNTQDEALLDAIDAISDYSFVTFSWNEDGECTRIGNSTQSFYIPNFKLKK